MKTVTLYTTQWCPFCLRAKSLLASKGVEFDEIAVDGNPSLRAEMAAMAGATSVPQIWIGDQYVGGCDELYSLEGRQQLDSMLRVEAP
jgi:glutaredoxin 3